MNEDQGQLTGEQHKKLTAELAFRLARMQAWTIACTEMGIDFAMRKEMHQYIDVLHEHLSKNGKVRFSDLLKAMWKIDDCMLEILQQKIEEVNAKKD